MPDSVALRRSLDQLQMQTGDAVSRQQLQLLEKLLDRADRERAAVANLLCQRASQILTDVEQILASNLEQLTVDSSAAQASSLSALLSELRRDDDNNEQPRSPLDCKIQEQNARLMKGIEPATKPAETTEFIGLRAAKQLRHLQGRRASHRKVQFALDNRPENPGPLNPHMLAVQILSEIQSQSPEYLERLVSYLDTLALLDQQGAYTAKIAARKKEKSPLARSSRARQTGG